MGNVGVFFAPDHIRRLSWHLDKGGLYSLIIFLGAISFLVLISKGGLSFKKLLELLKGIFTFDGSTGKGKDGVNGKERELRFWKGAMCFTLYALLLLDGWLITRVFLLTGKRLVAEEREQCKWVGYKYGIKDIFLILGYVLIANLIISLIRYVQKEKRDEEKSEEKELGEIIFLGIQAGIISIVTLLPRITDFELMKQIQDHKGAMLSFSLLLFAIGALLAILILSWRRIRLGEMKEEYSEFIEIRFGADSPEEIEEKKRR